MASYTERGQIKAYAGLNPFSSGFSVPTETGIDAAFVEGAVVFLRRIESAIEDIAHDKIVDALPPPDGRGRPVPGSPESEALILAQRVQAGSVSLGRTALREILAQFDGSTPAQMFDEGTVTDAALKTYLLSIWNVLADYYHKPQNR